MAYIVTSPDGGQFYFKSVWSRHPHHDKATLLSVGAHGRYDSKNYFKNYCHGVIPIPTGKRIIHYVHHGKSLSLNLGNSIFDHLTGQAGNPTTPDKRIYGAPLFIKNYSLSHHRGVYLRWKPTEQVSILIPLQNSNVYTKDVIDLLASCNYEEIHFMHCRDNCLPSSLGTIDEE